MNRRPLPHGCDRGYETPRKNYYFDSTQRMIHWMLDPETGKPWGTSEAVAITFDLDARKIVPITQEAQAALSSHITPGLTL